MIDIEDIRCRYQGTAAFPDERGRRLFAANEALAHQAKTRSATGCVETVVDARVR
jgi:hypothetical protein